jgi:hypothetical protein
MNRLDTLKAAAECVCGSREEDYGSPEDNFAVIAALWTAYTGTDTTPKDVAMMMALLKIARAKAGSKPDTYVDLAGYAACGAEISARDPKSGTQCKKNTTSGAAGGTETEKTASCVKLQRMDGYYLVDVDGNPHRFTLWETAMQFIREHAGELT